MWKATLAVLVVVSLPARARAAAPDCFYFVLGIYDEPEQVHNFGTMVENQEKWVYLGIKYRSGQAGLTTIEFSISGLEELFVLEFEPVTPAALVFGSVQAPPDTTSSFGVGGMDVSWPICLEGDRALIRLTLWSLGPVQADKILEVKRRYPPTNFNFSTPLFVNCDAPVYPMVRVGGGCYILNPSTNPVPACQLPVAAHSWSQVKALFR